MWFFNNIFWNALNPIGVFETTSFNGVDLLLPSFLTALILFHRLFGEAHYLFHLFKSWKYLGLYIFMSYLMDIKTKFNVGKTFA